MDSRDRAHVRSTLMMLGMYATLGLSDEQRADLPTIGEGPGDPPDLRDPTDVYGHRARPAAYGVHLSKAERRGKTYAELQALRWERRNG